MQLWRLSSKDYTLTTISISVHGRIKETARVDNLLNAKRAGWITSYPPVVNGNVQITQISSLKIAAKLFQVLYNEVFN